MPVHDWTRVRPGIFHDFHTSWISHLKEALNAGLLPGSYYALAEQRTQEATPDVLTLQAAEQESEPVSSGGAADPPQDATAVAERPPQVSFIEDLEPEIYASRRRTLVIRHVTEDRIVAFVEILSPGNKHGQKALDQLLDKALAALEQGYHLLIVDLFPPGSADPGGIHPALWSRWSITRYQPPPDKPLTLAAYEAGPVPRAYVEPVAVGSPLPPMPLFLEPGWYVDTPLEETYMAAWRGMPERWQRVIEGES